METHQKKLDIRLTHNLDSTGHVISILHDGQSCSIETAYQPILAVTGPGRALCAIRQGGGCIVLHGVL